MRIFFAIDPSPVHKAHLGDYIEIVRHDLEKNFEPAHFHWVRPENLHVTLQFMGEVKEEDIPLILTKVAKAIQSEETFNLGFGSLEWFPNTNQPKVLSLQVAPQDLLAKLSAAVGKGLIDSHYSIETRPFRGHLTLGRVDNLHHLSPHFLEFMDLPAFEPMKVKELVLFHSQPEKGRAVYTQLAKLSLR